MQVLWGNKQNLDPGNTAENIIFLKSVFKYLCASLLMTAYIY